MVLRALRALEEPLRALCRGLGCALASCMPHLPFSTSTTIAGLSNKACTCKRGIMTCKRSSCWGQCAHRGCGRCWLVDGRGIEVGGLVQARALALDRRLRHWPHSRRAAHLPLLHRGCGRSRRRCSCLLRLPLVAAYTDAPNRQAWRIWKCWSVLWITVNRK